MSTFGWILLGGVGLILAAVFWLKTHDDNLAWRAKEEKEKWLRERPKTGA